MEDHKQEQEAFEGLPPELAAMLGLGGPPDREEVEQGWLEQFEEMVEEAGEEDAYLETAPRLTEENQSVGYIYEIDGRPIVSQPAHAFCYDPQYKLRFAFTEFLYVVTEEDVKNTIEAVTQEAKGATHGIDAVSKEEMEAATESVIEAIGKDVGRVRGMAGVNIFKEDGTFVKRWTSPVSIGTPVSGQMKAALEFLSHNWVWIRNIVSDIMLEPSK